MAGYQGYSRAPTVFREPELHGGGQGNQELSCDGHSSKEGCSQDGNGDNAGVKYCVCYVRPCTIEV